MLDGVGTIPISIHSLRVEGDRRILTMQEEGAISIHSLRVEGDGAEGGARCGRKISIHSLRVEGDTIEGREWHGKSISIHSLRVEGDIGGVTHLRRERLFQSTPSVWRETT